MSVKADVFIRARHQNRTAAPQGRELLGKERDWTKIAADAVSHELNTRDISPDLSGDLSEKGLRRR